MENEGFQNDVRREDHKEGANEVSPVAPPTDNNIEDGLPTDVDERIPCNCGPSCTEEHIQISEDPKKPAKKVELVSWTSTKLGNSTSSNIFCLENTVEESVEDPAKATSSCHLKNNVTVINKMEQGAHYWRTNCSSDVVRVSEATETDTHQIELVVKDTKKLSKMKTPSNSISKYSEFCSCGELKEKCECSNNNKFSFWERILPRNASYWPKLKLFAMIFLGSIPWVFLMVYLVIYFL